MAWWRTKLSRLAGGTRLPPAGRTAATIASNPGSECTEIAALLSACAGERTHATLVQRDQGSTHALRFTSFSERCVRFALTTSRGLLRIEPLSVCWVSFVAEGLPTAFLSQILEAEEGHAGEPASISLRTPTRLARENLRSADRLPDLRSSDLEVRIATGDGSFRTADPLDLSLSGTLLELRGDSDLGVAELHQTVDLELKLASHSAWLMGVVRRRSGRRVGIHFPEALRRGRIDPPAELARIVRQLENNDAAVGGRATLGNGRNREW